MRRFGKRFLRSWSVYTYVRFGDLRLDVADRSEVGSVPDAVSPKERFESPVQAENAFALDRCLCSVECALVHA